MTQARRNTALPLLGLILLTVALAVVVVAERRVDREHEHFRATLATCQLQLDAVTSIRRDVRKAYVAALEATLGPFVLVDGPPTPPRSMVENIDREAATFIDVHWTKANDADQAAALGKAIAVWATDMASGHASAGHFLLTKLKADVADVDRICESIRAGSSVTAREATTAAAAAEGTRRVLRSASLVLVLVLFAGGLAWRIRKTTKARLLAAEQSKRDQEAINARLERIVSERTQELAKSLEQLRESQSQLIQAGKLVAVGQLAAGIAHEINTPIQFAMDNLCFILEAVGDILGLLERYRGWCVEHSKDSAIAAEISQAEETADLGYLKENLPKALDTTRIGLERVAAIVRSTKEFAHPNQTDRSMLDLNHAMDTTLTIARSEYMPVADVTTDYGDLPSISCYVGELNQVLLNIVVNAAQAIREKVKDSGERGAISVRTRRETDSVVVSVADTGNGIPRTIWERIYDPFFTTKAVGKGIGQGLAIARSVVVNKHGGQLTFDTEDGKGTTFHVRLPATATSH